MCNFIITQSISLPAFKTFMLTMQLSNHAAGMGTARRDDAPRHHLQASVFHFGDDTRPRGFTTLFMLNLTEHEISTVYKIKC